MLDEPEQGLPDTAEFGGLVEDEDDGFPDTAIGILLKPVADLHEADRGSDDEFAAPGLLIAGAVGPIGSLRDQALKPEVAGLAEEVGAHFLPAKKEATKIPSGRRSKKRARLVLRRDKGRGRKSSRVCTENGIRADDVMKPPKMILAGRLPAPVRWVCCQDLIATIKQIPNERLVRDERGQFSFDGLITIITNSDFWMFNRQP
jgi:hypothetical protein